MSSDAAVCAVRPAFRHSFAEKLPADALRCERAVPLLCILPLLRSHPGKIFRYGFGSRRPIVSKK